MYALSPAVLSDANVLHLSGKRIKNGRNDCYAAGLLGIIQLFFQRILNWLVLLTNWRKKTVGLKQGRPLHNESSFG
jgi:hypothetical protein